MKQSILLTGGTGYLGSHTAVELIEQGERVILLDNLTNSYANTVERILTITNVKPTFYKGEVGDKALLKDIFKKENVGTVMHFAGSKGIGPSLRTPYSYYENNISTLFHLCSAMSEMGLKDLIFSSSSTVYSDESIRPYSEDTGIISEATSPYGTSKIIAENILRELSRCQGFNIIALRYFNPIGAHTSGILGENPLLPPSYLLSNAMKIADESVPSLSIYGNDLDTKDGTGVRDFLHVQDLAECHLNALSHIKQGNTIKGKFEAFNVCSGVGTSVLDIVNGVREVSGKDIPVKWYEKRPGDILEYYGDPNKALKFLRWKVKRTVLDAIEDAWKYHTNNK